MQQETFSLKIQWRCGTAHAHATIPDDFFSLITHEQRIALNQKQQFIGLSVCSQAALSTDRGSALESRGQRVLLLETDGIARPANVRTDDLR